MEICKYCGERLPEGSRFCRNCGRVASSNGNAMQSNGQSSNLRISGSLGGGTREENRTDRQTCPYCGARIAQGAAFCAACGQRLASQGESREPEPGPERPRKRRGGVWGIVALGAVVLLAAALLLGRHLTREPKPQETVAPEDGTLAGETTPTDLPEPTPGISAEQARALYETYFWKEFSTNDLACMADVTHDGVDELIVVHFCDEEGERIEGYVFTIDEKEQVKGIYSKVGSAFHVGGYFNWYIREGDSGFILGSEEGYWNTGHGELTFHEYYLTQDGAVQDISSVSVNSEDYVTEGGISDAFDRYTEREAQVKGQMYTLYCCPGNGDDADAIARYPMDPMALFSVEHIEAGRVYPTRFVDYTWSMEGRDADYLLERLEMQSRSMNFDFAIILVDTLDGKSAQEFADGYYDCHGFGYGPGKDGALLLIDTADELWYLTTHGAGIELIGDRELAELQESFSYDLKQGDYYGACNSFIDKAGEIVSRKRG